MSIRRYVREDDGSIYDRLKRKYIEVRTEKKIGERYFVNAQTEDELVISTDDIEEVR